MNFYPLWIGDLARRTAHLNLIQQGALRALLDHYYSTERPLAAELEILNRICRATGEEEQRAVESVALEFFPIGSDGLRHNRRCDREIEKARARIEAARRNGQKGGKPPKTQQVTQPEPAGLPSGLVFPSNLTPEEKELVRRHLAGLTPEVAQQVVDEMVGYDVPVTKVGYLNALIVKAKIGEFRPCVAHRVAAVRARERSVRLANEGTKTAASAATVVKQLEEMKRTLGIGDVH